jgi:hypothetical protein
MNYSPAFFVAIAMITITSSTRVLAHEGEQIFNSLETAHSAEKECLKVENNEERYDCLGEIADFWFHGGPKGFNDGRTNYLNMIRIMELQEDAIPDDIELIQAIAFYKYSVETSDIMDGTLKDYTIAIFDALMRNNEINKDKVEYQLAMAHVNRLVAGAPNEIGTIYSKSPYFASMLSNIEQAKLLLSKIEVTPENKAEIDFYNNSIRLYELHAGRIRIKHQEMDEAQ